MSAKLSDDDTFRPEPPPLFEEFMAQVKSRATRKVKEYYRISDNVQPHSSSMFYFIVFHFSPVRELDINKDLIFRGNIWQVLLDIDKAMHPKMFLKKLYDCTSTWGEVITSVDDDFMDAIEEVLHGIAINIRQVTMFKSKHKRRKQSQN